MYIMGTLRNFRMELQTHHMNSLSRKIAIEEGKNRLFICLDMIYSSMRYGIKFAEYYNMDFVHRTLKNRDTYITTNYNFRIYNKINLKKNRSLFHNKIKFNHIYSDFISRDWVDINKVSESEFELFIKDKKSVVLKKSCGDSGSGVEIINLEEQSALQVIGYCRRKGFDLVEETIKNHEHLDFFNGSSLNTVRIVTLTNGKMVRFLYAGLRVGAKGCGVDNISQGGAVANIDLKSGKLSHAFFGKKNTVAEESLAGKDFVGYQLPFWEELIKSVTDMALKAPSMGYVAWDIAITPNGPEVIEGNESFGSVILQAHRGVEEEGLKPALTEILRDLNIKI